MDKTQKVCNTCNELKPYTEFYPKTAQCIKCRVIYYAQYAHDHAEELRDYAINNKISIAKRKAKWYQSNKKRISKQQREYRQRKKG